MPGRDLQAFLYLFWRDLPEGLDDRLAVERLLTGAVQGGGAGVDQVQNPPCRQAGRLVASHPLDGFGAPVGTHIGKDLGCSRQEVTKEHANSIQGIVLGGQNERLSDAIPVEGRVENRFHKVAVREVVGPLALPLETGSDGIAS